MEETRRGAAEVKAAVGSVVVRGENLIARDRSLVATQSGPTALAPSSFRSFDIRHSGSLDGRPDARTN